MHQRCGSIANQLIRRPEGFHKRIALLAYVLLVRLFQGTVAAVRVKITRHTASSSRSNIGAGIRRGRMTARAGELVETQHTRLGKYVIADLQPAFDHLQSTTADETWTALGHLSQVAQRGAAQHCCAVDTHKGREKDRTLSEDFLFLRYKEEWHRWIQVR